MYTDGSNEVSFSMAVDSEGSVLVSHLLSTKHDLSMIKLT